MSSKRSSRLEQLQYGQLEIIDALYSAVADPNRWSEVVEATEKTLGGSVSIIYRPTPSLSHQRLLATNLDLSLASAYETYYGAINPWAVALQGPRPAVHFNDGPIEASVVERSEFYSDWLRPIGDLRYSFSLCTQVSGGAFVELGSVRPRRMGPVTEPEQFLLRSLIPHLQRAAQLSQRLQLAELGRGTLDLAVQRLGTNVILVDANRRVAFVPPAAELTLRRSGLTIRQGYLRATPPLDAALGEAITAAAGGGRTMKGRTASLLTAPRSGNGPPFSVMVGPVDERDQPGGLAGPLAMVLITDPELGARPSEEGLQALHDLTPAEAKLVVALCTGETLASYAEATGTSLNTVKTHLKRAFDKTGETRQADLVRRVSNDLALRFGIGEANGPG